MPVYVVVSEGPDPQSAVPILAVGDQAAIRALFHALLARCAGPEPPGRPADLVPRGELADPEAGG